MKPIGIDIGLSKNSGGELSLEMLKKCILKIRHLKQKKSCKKRWQIYGNLPFFFTESVESRCTVNSASVRMVLNSCNAPSADPPFVMAWAEKKIAVRL